MTLAFSHLVKGNKVNDVLNDLSDILFDFRALKSVFDKFKWVSEINIFILK